MDRTTIKFNPSGVPKDLRTFPCALWKGKLLPSGKVQKRPRRVNGVYANINDAKHFSTFDVAVAAWKAGNYDGIGVLMNGKGTVGIDLDHCRSDDGTITSEAIKIINQVKGYTEVSPSGHGIRIFVKGDIPVGGKRKGGIEVYKSGRFLTVTGHALDGSPKTVPDRTAELAAFYKSVFGNNDKASPNKKIEQLKAGNWKGFYRVRKARQT